MFIEDKIAIAGIQYKDMLREAHGETVQTTGYQTSYPILVEYIPQSRNHGRGRYSAHFCRNASINIGFDGIVEDVIRSFLSVNAVQRPQVFQLRQRVHPRTAKLNRNVSDIGTCRLILASLGSNQDYFKAVIGVTVDDITPEVDEVAEAVVGEEDFHFLQINT